MQKSTAIYFLIVFVLSIVGCKKEVAKSVDKLLLPNDVYISGFKNDSYIVAQNGKIIITPIIKRENEATENDLDFEWTIGDVVVSDKRDLNINLPYEVSNGDKRGRYRVRSKLHGKMCTKEFNVTVTNPFGYGYYFLSVDKSNETLLSHLNIIDNSETIFHTSKIGDVNIGAKGNSLYSYAKYNKPLDKLIYNISITTESGDNPYIVTDNVTMAPQAIISSKAIAGGFSPSFYFPGHQIERVCHFVSKGGVVTSTDKRLTYCEKGAYDWGCIIAGNNDRYLYGWDTKAAKFFAISVSDSYKISPINGDNPSGEHIIGMKLRNYYDNGTVVDEVKVITYSDGRLSSYIISGSEIKIVGRVSVGGVVTRAVHVADDDWYVGGGSVIYRYNGRTNSVTQHALLDGGLGDIAYFALSSKGSKLVIATNNSHSNSPMGGSIVILDNMTKSVTTHANSLYNCVGITCCDSAQF